MNTDLRQHAPASERNREPILAVLNRFLPAAGDGLVLEVASGTGQHTAWFAAAFPHLTWQPSDAHEPAHESIRAWITHEAVTNARPPIHLDAAAPHLPDIETDTPVVAMLNVNMIHISPWAACEGLMAKAGDLLPPGGHLIMYGPYARGGAHTASSNAAFDDSLRARNPAWGIRNLEDVIACAAANDLNHVDTIDMPANNLSVVYQRR
ncbi:MAG: DUF938 domain-containing protein [Alphaproteobacteria bacterium]|nr:DUF938 domain-containing protein [Alphaproteobacteria bacterium]